MLRSIRAALGDHPDRMGLAEEIAARVWLGLLESDRARLDAFDPNRGCRIATYLDRLARSEALIYLRSERRRRQRERLRSRSQATMATSPDQAQSLVIAEFLPRLTRRERTFFLQQLLVADHDQPQSLSQANAWQLRSRILRKLQQFLAREDAIQPARNPCPTAARIAEVPAASDTILSA